MEFPPKPGAPRKAKSPQEGPLFRGDGLQEALGRTAEKKPGCGGGGGGGRGAGSPLDLEVQQLRVVFEAGDQAENMR